MTAVPFMDDAACLGRWQLYDFTIDGDNPAADQRALQVCDSCPVLAQCQAWLESLPASRKPVGVCAGRIHRPRRVRRKEVTPT